MKDLVEDAKKRPGEITFSSSGVYGASHVPMEMFLQAAGGLEMRHLPTTGGGPATTAVLGGHAQLWTSPPGVGAPHLKAGKPTLKELGYDLEYYLWTGILAPKNTPPHVMKILREATRKAIQEPDFKAAMDKIQTPIAYQDAGEFNAWWAEDAKRLAVAIQRIGKAESK